MQFFYFDLKPGLFHIREAYGCGLSAERGVTIGLNSQTTGEKAVDTPAHVTFQPDGSHTGQPRREPQAFCCLVQAGIGGLQFQDIDAKGQGSHLR